MSIELTQDQARALAASSDAPPTVTDPTTRTTYVLLRSDEYDRVKGLITADDPDALYPLLAETDPDDWEDASAHGIGRETLGSVSAALMVRVADGLKAALDLP